MRDLQTTIKSLEEKFEVQQQMVQYVQNKAESTDSKFSSYRLDVNIPRSNNPIRKLPVPGDFVEAVFQPENFRMISGRFLPESTGI